MKSLDKLMVIKKFILCSIIVVTAALQFSCATTGGTKATGSLERLETQKAVQNAQSMLKDLNYNVGTVDGLYGPKTRAAILAYQKDQSMQVNGIVSNRLLSALRLSINVSKSQGGSSQDLDLVKRNDTVAATAGGAVVGGLIGWAAGKALGVDERTSAAAGASVGGAAGYKVGKETGERREEYSLNVEELDRAYKDRSDRASILVKQMQILNGTVDVRQGELDDLVESNSNAESELQKAEALRNDLEKDAKKTKDLLRDTDELIRIVQSDIDNVNAELKSIADPGPFIQKRDRLTEKKSELVATYNSINGILPQIEQQLSVVTSLN